jgi:hypothetical protein
MSKRKLFDDDDEEEEEQGTLHLFIYTKLAYIPPTDGGYQN